MKIHFMSDIHLEWVAVNHRTKFLQELCPGSFDTGGAILVMAGDISNARDIPVVAEMLSSRYTATVYVPGNHEWYGIPAYEVRDLVKGIENTLPPNVHLLWNDVVEIGGVQFVGTPLWFPYDPMNLLYEKGMADFAKIRDLGGRVYQWSEEAREFLMETVTDKSVVVTHHLPLEFSIPERFKFSSINRFFVNNIPNVLMYQKPRLWLHGHIHDSCDYTFGDTRVVCNPFGYHKVEVNQNFNDRLILEV